MVRTRILYPEISDVLDNPTPSQLPSPIHHISAVESPGSSGVSGVSCPGVGPFCTRSSRLSGHELQGGFIKSLVSRILVILVDQELRLGSIMFEPVHGQIPVTALGQFGGTLSINESGNRYSSDTT